MTEAVYQEKILWRRAVFVIRSDAAGGLLSISALRREAADDIESALPPRGSRGQRQRKLFGSTWTSQRLWRPKNGFRNP